MAQTPVTTGNHSFQRYNAWARYKTPATVLWGSGGNTCTITDDKISANSIPDFWVTGTTPQAGQWSYVLSSGSITITSSSSESATLPVSYTLL